MLSNCGAGENLRVSWATRRSKSLNPRGNQSWIITGMTAAEAEALILWPFEVKSQIIGKDWCWERLKAKGQQKWAAEDEMVRSITDSVDMNLSKLWEIMLWERTEEPGMLLSMSSQRVRHDLTTEQEQVDILSLMSFSY